MGQVARAAIENKDGGFRYEPRISHEWWASGGRLASGPRKLAE